MPISTVLGRAILLTLGRIPRANAVVMSSEEGSKGVINPSGCTALQRSIDLRLGWGRTSASPYNGGALPLSYNSSIPHLKALEKVTAGRSFLTPSPRSATGSNLFECPLLGTSAGPGWRDTVPHVKQETGGSF